MLRGPRWRTSLLWLPPKYLFWLSIASRRSRGGVFMRWGEEQPSPGPLVIFTSSFTFNLVGLILSLSCGAGWPVQSLWPWPLGQGAEREVSEGENLTFAQQNRGYQCHHGCPEGFLQEAPRAAAHLPTEQSLHWSSWWDLMTQNITVRIWLFFLLFWDLQQ